MRKLLQKIFRKPLVWLANRFSSAPVREDVFNGLSDLERRILEGKADAGIVAPFNVDTDRLIIFSDQHKGGQDGADDFMPAAANYQAALTHYYNNGFTFVNLGDCEELWECTPSVAVEKNRLSLLEEARFLQQQRYYRVFGNHDVEWKLAEKRDAFLKPLFGQQLKVYEGIILKTAYNGKDYSIFLTHGHQGDHKSDGNAFSVWFVAAIWTPIQRFMEISINTVADSFDLVDAHNIIMYEWAATRRDTILISGHTHKPVFASLDHIDRLNRQLLKAREANDIEKEKALTEELQRRQQEYAGKKLVKTMAHPSYFNTGCCCFSDGDITGIEIAEGFIRLVKWKDSGNGSGITRIVLEESPLYYIFEQL